MYPLIVMAFGIFICLLVSILATHIAEVDSFDKIEKTLKIQLFLSTLILAGIALLAAYLTYPSGF
jgi:hypothetical protein